jgi:hypothetical protein
MRYIKTYENFKPIKHNLAKPFKIKKNIDTSINHLKKRIKSLRKRLDDQKFGYGKVRRQRSEMNKDKNEKIQKLNDLTFKKIKQNVYLKEHPIKENIDNPKNLFNILNSPNFKPEDIDKYIGFDENDYQIEAEIDYYSNKKVSDEIKLLIKSEELEDLVNIENGIINYLFHVRSDYGGYEYYVDNNELDYLSNYLTDDILNKIKKLGELFEYDIDPNKEGEIHEFFNYLGLKRDLDDFKMEISSENEEAVRKSAKAILVSVPFEIDQNYSKNFDLSLNFQYDVVKEYIEKHKLFEVKTIKEFVENVYEFSEFNYDFEYNLCDYIGHYDDLKRSVENVVEKYLDSPDDIFIKLIEVDNLELFKKKINLANFDYIYDTCKDYSRVRLNLFEFAKLFNNSITEWFKSEEFENIIKKRSKEEFENYKNFILGEDAEKYNL